MDASGNVTATNTFGANGLVSRRTGGASGFFAFDPQGSVVEQLDSTGTVVANNLYDAYGNKLNAGISAPFGYGAQTGYYTDPETGLMLLTHRYYDPTEGRFLTRDTIGYAGGMNLYGYCGGNPVGRLDPSGLIWDLEDCGNFINAFPHVKPANVDWIDQGFQNESAFFGGMGDILSFGGTKKIRQQLGLDDYACKNSDLYLTGQISGAILGLSIYSGVGALGCEALNTKLLSVAAKRAELAALTAASDRLIQQAIQNDNPRPIAEGYGIRCVNYLINRYGGQVEDWSKNSTANYECSRGKIEIHYYWNEATKTAYEMKTNLIKWKW